MTDKRALAALITKHILSITTKKRYIDFHGCITANLTIGKLPIVAQSQIDNEILA